MLKFILLLILENFVVVENENTESKEIVRSNVVPLCSKRLHLMNLNRTSLVSWRRDRDEVGVGRGSLFLKCPGLPTRRDFIRRVSDGGPVYVREGVVASVGELPPRR